PGLRPARNIPTMASEHVDRFGHGHAEVFFEACRVPMENLLGERGQGFKIAQMRLGPGRIHHCMRWLGVARRAFDMLCERALQREMFGSRLADKETVQNWIADSAAEMQAARLMTLHAAWKIDQFGAPAARTDISMIKFFGAKVLLDVIDRAIQLHGALGFSADLPLEAMYRESRAARFYDGPDEVHRVTVARQILKGYSAPEGLWPREHVPTRRAMAQRKFAARLEALTANS
ncbi:MAG: acyl-CoA dehydrogenase, partial [Chloroflexota bacterium]|nr:acyl-CoA dehydrogenase [Chloroflexota bacterium]